MKPTELMIGDWVDIFPDYCQILSIGKKGRIYTTTVSNYKVESDIGIYITPAILEANGFEKVENHTEHFYRAYINHSPIYMTPTIGDQWEVSIYQNGKLEMYIKHVHELQHILRLQGLTDFADQFKVKGDEK